MRDTVIFLKGNAKSVTSWWTRVIGGPESAGLGGISYVPAEGGARCRPPSLAMHSLAPKESGRSGDQAREELGLLDQNWLKGQLGDAIHVLLYAAGQDLYLILRVLALLYCACVCHSIGERLLAPFVAGCQQGATVMTIIAGL